MISAMNEHKTSIVTTLGSLRKPLLSSNPKPVLQLYLCSDEGAAQAYDNPCDHPAHHDQLPVIPVSEVPEDWSQQHETADKNCE